MAVNGRINVDVLFHDTDGTTSLKVVSLEGSTEYTTGKVAIVTGTVGTASVNIGTQPMSPEYRNGEGQVVSFAAVTRVVFQSSRRCEITDPNNNLSRLTSSGNASVSDWMQDAFYVEVAPGYSAGTASYTLVLYGT